MPFANAWDETYPPGSLSADQINEAIVYWAIAIRERMNNLLGITDWATAVMPILPSSLAFRGATPFIVAGSASFIFRNNANTLTNLTIAEIGDITARRNVISSSNLISNANLVFNASSGKVLPGSVSLLFRDFADANTNFSITDIGDIALRRDLAIGRNTTITGTLGVTGSSSLASTTVTNGQGVIARIDSGDITGATNIDWATGNNKRIRLIGNSTLTFLNPVAGAFYTLEVVQDGTGSRLITWPASVKWSAGAAPTLTTGVTKIDIISFYYNGTNYLGLPTGFNY